MMKTILVALAIFASIVMVQGGPESQIVTQFCETTLLQTPADSNQCFEKPKRYTSNNDQAALIFLCCLNFFQDVTHDYINFMDPDFIQFVVELKTDKFIINLGKFIMMCKNSSHQLTTQEYHHWDTNGKTAQVCPIAN